MRTYGLARLTRLTFPGLHAVCLTGSGNLHEGSPGPERLPAGRSRLGEAGRQAFPGQAPRSLSLAVLEHQQAGGEKLAAFRCPRLAAGPLWGSAGSGWVSAPWGSGLDPVQPFSEARVPCGVLCASWPPAGGSRRSTRSCSVQACGGAGWGVWGLPRPVSFSHRQDSPGLPLASLRTCARRRGGCPPPPPREAEVAAWHMSREGAG